MNDPQRGKKIEDSMEAMLQFDVILDNKKIQLAVTKGTDAAIESTDILQKLNASIAKKLEGKQDEDMSPGAVVMMQTKIASAVSNMAKSLDMMYRLAEFSQGRADSRPELSRDSFMKDMSDDLLAAMERELRAAQQAQEDLKQVIQTPAKGYVQ